MLKRATHRTLEQQIDTPDGHFIAHFRLLTDAEMQAVEFKPPVELVQLVLLATTGLELVKPDDTLVPADQVLAAIAEDVELCALIYDTYVDLWQKKALPQTWQKRLAAWSGLDKSKPTSLMA